MPKKAEFVSDDDFLDGGEVPIFVEDCQHARMWKAPSKGKFAITACKDCGQPLIADMKGKWENGRRDRIPLPVTLDKILNNCVSLALGTIYNYK